LRETKRAMGWAAATAVIALLTAPGASHAQAEKDVTAEKCGVDFNKPAARVFVDATAKEPWTEIRDIRTLPDVNLNDGGKVARVWAGSDRNMLVFVEEPGEEFDIGSEYCFDKDGSISRIRFRVRTEWDWGFREEGPVKDGAIAAETKEFFDTEKGTAIPEPNKAAEIPEVWKPHVYQKISDLPFAKFLEPAKADQSQ
jgi:hypothetical protein